jgi:glycosyltransferase involved in cell wall biosynthesis
LPDRFLLHLGTLEPRKNLPMLLRAYAALPSDLRGAVKLVLAGGRGWDYQDVLNTITQYGLAQEVFLPGYIKAEDLPFWYNAADVLVYPSLYEGWGLPVVEAMACGCPTLVSDTSSLPEAAGETGMRLSPHDEGAWRDALRRVLTDAEWRKTSRAAGIKRAKQFTWRGTAEAFIKTYRTVLEGNE